jgi:hypothetical protein
MITWHKETSAQKNKKLFTVDKVLEPGAPMDLVKSLVFSHRELLNASQLDVRKLKDSYSGKLFYQGKVRVFSVAEPKKIHTILTEPDEAFHGS